jgi:arylsulfatase A-like enzyme
VKRIVSSCLAALALTPGCSCRSASDGPAPSGAVTAATAPDASAIPEHPVVLDVVRDLDACALGHRGVLVDFGDSSSGDDVRAASAARGDNEVVEHEGATWLRVRSRAIAASFYWPASESADASAYVELRVRGVTARSAAVTIDGRPIGTVTLSRSEARVVVARAATPVTLAVGGHELGLRFIGGPRAGDEALVEIDWAHVGTGETGEPYAAPTRADVVLQAATGGRSLRALSLRAPGFVRCSGWLPSNATLEASLATAGGGEASVEARLLRDRRPPVLLGTARAPGANAGWSAWSVPVTGLDGAGALASIELSVTSAAKGTRVLLGEPRVIGAAGAGRRLAGEAPPPARGVVVVVLGSTAAKSLAPWGGAHATPELSRLAASGTTFTANRSVSSLSSAVMATILTGLPPRLHGVDDPDARLPKGPVTVQEACRQGGVATALFTANPTTGAAFGFERGWDTFVAHDPLEEAPASRVFDDAAGWIEQHKADRFLVVIHARGGHPPWDATLEDLKTMPPEGYLGIVEPRRAAEALAKARKHPGRFKDEDRVRAFALYDRAIEAHDQALGHLLAGLAAAGRDGDTAVIVTADVGASEGALVPFTDPESLDEPLLATPLVLRWPHADALSGRVVDAPSSSLDVARTVLDALGLAPPAAFQGIDLTRIARGAVVPAERPLTATRAGRFAVRWGPFVMLGAGDRELRMCDLSLDPTCVADVRATSPLALEPLHRAAADASGAAAGRAGATAAGAGAAGAAGGRGRPAPYPREPVVLDEHALQSLVRWGRPTAEHGSSSGAGDEP